MTLAVNPVRKAQAPPPDPDLVRLVEALADAAALRDHRAAITARAQGKAKAR